MLAVLIIDSDDWVMLVRVWVRTSHQEAPLLLPICLIQARAPFASCHSDTGYHSNHWSSTSAERITLVILTGTLFNVPGNNE